MIEATSQKEAESLGAEVIIKDAEDKWRCYMPGEIQRSVVEDAKDAKRAEINAARDAAVIAPVSALGHVWDADEHSQSLLGKAILLASLGVPLPAVWRDYNDQDLVVTSIDQLLAITGAMAAATQAAYTAAFARKDALKSATTLEEIEAI